MKPALLIVDDDRSVRESLKRLLEGEQFQVHAAGDAAEAMELYSSRAIDLVILDINLGKDDGWALFERMAVRKPSVPAIVVTAEWGAVRAGGGARGGSADRKAHRCAGVPGRDSGASGRERAAAGSGRPVVLPVHQPAL